MAQHEKGSKWTSDERKAVLGRIAALAAAMRAEIDEAVLLGFELGLSDLSASDVIHGVGRAIRECRYLPSVYELRQLCGVVPMESRALIAWSEAVQAVKSVGSYRSVEFADGVTAACVRHLGGWVEFCDLAGEERIRREFLTAYERLSKSGVTPEMAAPFRGIVDATNHANGHTVGEFVRVGTAIQHEQNPQRLTTTEAKRPANSHTRRLADSIGANQLKDMPKERNQINRSERLAKT